MRKNIVLIGFMGTGKSSVGRILAKKLHWGLRDVDRMIEAKEKRKIRDIFEKDGEAYFRRAEMEMIRGVSRENNVVITTGGGAVLDAENWASFSANGWVVALHASAEMIYKRVKNSKNRPLLQGTVMISEIKKLLDVRKPFYHRADFSLDTDGKNASQAANLILRALGDKK